MVVDISEKFGASWLGKSPTPAVTPRTPPSPAVTPGAAFSAASEAPAVANTVPAAFAPVSAERAMLAKQILAAVGEAQDKTDQVYNLIDRTGLDISKVLPVVDWLEATGFVSVTRDNHGNHVLHLTEAGEAWIS